MWEARIVLTHKIGRSVYCEGVVQTGELRILRWVATTSSRPKARYRPATAKVHDVVAGESLSEFSTFSAPGMMIYLRLRRLLRCSTRLLCSVLLYPSRAFGTEVAAIF